MKFRGLIAAALLATASSAAMAGSEASNVVSVRSVREAVDRAMERALDLQAATAARKGAEGGLDQAGLLPNPQLTIEAENFAGSGVNRGFRAVEVTVGISQLIELGGKRAARRDIAQAELTLAGHDYEAVRRDLVRDVVAVYSDAVAAARAVQIARERVAIANDVAKAVGERLEAGKEPLIQARRADVSRSAAKIAEEQAVRKLKIARRALATMMATPDVEFVVDHSWFENIGPPPSTSNVTRGVLATPEYQRWDAVIDRSRAALSAEEAAAVPDLTVGAGIRRFQDTGDSAFLASVSIPIPVFNRNQGAIRRAGADLVLTEVNARKARLLLTAALAEAEQKLANAWGEANALVTSVIPAANEAFAFARDGYRSGKFSFLDVIDTQRTLLDAKEQLNEALRQVHVSRAEVDRLASAPAAAGER